MVAFHPATLVRLRTQTPSTKLNTYFRAAAKETAQMIKENEFVMFGNGAFPQRSPFYESALDHVIIGGEAFQLSWPYGIEEPDQEVGESSFRALLWSPGLTRVGTLSSTCPCCTAAYVSKTRRERKMQITRTQG